MAEGGIELGDFDRPVDVEDYNDETTPFMNIPHEDSMSISRQEVALGDFTGDTLTNARKQLLISKVDAFLQVIADREGHLPTVDVYSEFELDKDGRTLFLKEGHVAVTWKNDPSKYVSLRTLADRTSTDWIRTHLFPDYTSAPTVPPRRKPLKRLAMVRDNVLATETASENIELSDLPQRATDVDTAVKSLFTDISTSTDDLPYRELLGLDEALQRQRGVLVDNLARLSQLDADIAHEQEELGGEEAANNPEKKQRIEALLERLGDERASRLEAAAANREALRTQFSRIRETIDRILNEDTTLAERIRTLFREQGITTTTILTALGLVVSTIVLAIQNTFGVVPAPAPTPAPDSTDGVAKWVKKQLKTLADWLKKLAEKAAAALPGVIGAIVSWLLKTAGSVAVWFAGHLWVLAAALVAASTVWLRNYRQR